MEQNALFNTGTGLSALDDQVLTRLTVEELVVENDLQLPNGLVLPTDLLPLQTMRNNINALTNGQLMINTGTDTFTSTANNSSEWDTDTALRNDFNTQTTNNLLFRDGTNSYGNIAKSNDYTTSNDIVQKTSGVIKTNKLTAGDSDLTSGDININKSSGTSILNIVNPSGQAPRIYLIRQNGSSSFGGDGSSDWAFVNLGGHLDFDRGNSGLTNGFVSPLRLSFTNAIEINQHRGGATVDHCPLRHYRQVAGNLNNYYVDVFPDSSVSGAFQQKLPAESGTYITDNTTAFVNLNTMNTNINALTNNNLMIKTGTNTFSDIATDNAFGSGSLIVKKDTGTIKSENFLAKQAGNGYMFQSFSNSAVISYLYHSNNSGLGVAVEMPSTSGVLGLTSQIAWNVSSGNITTKGANDNLGIGSPSSFPSRITFAGGIESKICLFDGGSGNMYGFGISSNQLNYHVNTTSDKHCFYVNGTNGNGTKLLEIAGNKNTTLNGSLIIQDTVAGTAKITLQDATDHDDIDILFQGYNGSTLIDNAVIRTENNYLNLETSNTSPMNGIRLSTNSTLAMTIDNNQNAIFENQVGIGKNPATGFTLDVDGTNPSVFRGTVNYLGQATYNPDGGSFPPTYFMGLRLASGVQTLTLNTLTLSSDKTINFPDTTGTVAVKNASGQLQVDELVGTLGGSTKIDLTPGGGNIDLVVPNSSGGLSPNVDINFKTDTKVRMNLNSIDGIVFHENFIFKNTTGSTYFPLSFNGSVANSLNVGTAVLNLPSADLDMGTGDLTMTSGDLQLTSGGLDVQSGGVEIGSGNFH